MAPPSTSPPTETTSLLPPVPAATKKPRRKSSSHSRVRSHAASDSEGEDEDVGSMLSRVIGVDIEGFATGYGTVEHERALREARKHHHQANLNLQEEVLAEEVGEAEEEDEEEGRSTFWQALFNTVGDLVGTGLLACPLAFAYCGWIGGTIVLLFLGFLTHRTLIILVRISLEDKSLRTYVEIVSKCFERKKINIRPYLTFLFVFEVVAWSMALVILSCDTLEALLPNSGVSNNQWKLLSFFLILPTAFLPLHLLSFTSLLGMLTSVVLILIILFNGFFAPSPSSPNLPWIGSILHPAQTDLFPTFGWLKLGAAGGLFMSLWGGHAIVPSVVRDLRPQDKHRWRQLIDVSYIIALVASATVGVAGYLMFGRNVSDEISLDIAKTPGVSKVLTTLAIWMVCVNPATKIPMGLKMLNDLLEIALDIYPARNPALPGSRMSSRPGSPVPKPDAEETINNLSDIREDDDVEEDIESEEEMVARWRRSERRKVGWRFVTRTSIVIILILLSILFPSFEELLAFMGSAPAFIVSAILPLLGKKFLYASKPGRGVTGWESVLDWALVGLAVLGAVGGVAGVLFGRGE